MYAKLSHRYDDSRYNGARFGTRFDSNRAVIRSEKAARNRRDFRANDGDNDDDGGNADDLSLV